MAKFLPPIIFCVFFTMVLLPNIAFGQNSWLYQSRQSDRGALPKLQPNNSTYRQPTTPSEQSSFNQNARTGITTDTANRSYTTFNDGSRISENRLTDHTSRVQEYNSATKAKREGIKYRTKYGYLLRYSDGSYEKLNQFGRSFTITQGDNLGNTRTGRQSFLSNNTTIYSDGTVRRQNTVGGQTTVTETGKKNGQNSN
jgi:ketosteroid isomerase-like protein